MGIDKTIEEIIGDPQELEKEILSFRENAEYFSTNAAILREKYPDQFIAVDGGKVVAHHGNVYRLMDQLDDLGLNRNGIYVGNTYQRKLIIMKKEAGSC